GHDSTAGVNALVLRAEIEEAVIRKYYGGQPNNNVPPAMQTPEQPNPTKAPEKTATATPPVKNETEKTAPAEKRPNSLDAKVRDGMSEARSYHYSAAKTDLDAILALATDEARKPAQAAQEFLKQESDLFSRCHTYLKTYIDKHPEHRSKIQVYPRKNDPNG